MSIREASFDLLSKEKILTNPDIYSQMVSLLERGYSRVNRWMGRERFEAENLPNTSRVAALFAGEGNGVAFATLNNNRIIAISAEKGYGVQLLRSLASCSEFSDENPLWITAEVTALEMINTIMSKRLASELIQDRLQTEQLYGRLNGVDIDSAEHRVNISIVGKNGLKIWSLQEKYEIPGLLKSCARESGALLAHHRLGATLHPEATYLQYAFTIKPRNPQRAWRVSRSSTE